MNQLTNQSVLFIQKYADGCQDILKLPVMLVSLIQIVFLCFCDCAELQKWLELGFSVLMCIRAGGVRVMNISLHPQCLSVKVVQHSPYQLCGGCEGGLVV